MTTSSPLLWILIIAFTLSDGEISINALPVTSLDYNTSQADEMKITQETKTDDQMNRFESSPRLQAQHSDNDNAELHETKHTGNSDFLEITEEHRDKTREDLSEEKLNQELDNSVTKHGNVDRDGISAEPDNTRESIVPANDPVDNGHKNLRADETGLIPGLSQIPTLFPFPSSGQGVIPGLGGSAQGGTPSLFIGGFSVLKMPMPGMSDMMSGFAQNIMPLFQGLPNLASLPNPFSG